MTLIHNQKDRISACYKNAHDFINAAKSILHNNGRPAIAYHLALLALEETGKATLIKIDSVLRDLGSEFVTIDEELANHNKKLLWALWTPWLDGKYIAFEEVSKVQILAQNMHQERLDSLYVSSTNDNPILNISIDKAENTIQIAEIRLDFEKMHSGDEVSVDKIEDYRWFINANEDEEKKKFIFSKISLDKLTSFNLLHMGEGMSVWVKWLHLKYKRQEQEMQIQLQKEIMKQRPVDEGLSSKWKIKIKLAAISHSIRQKELNFWNNNYPWLQLKEANKKKRELLIELTLPQHVLINEVWQHGYNLVRRMLLALNIGSIGFFWWYFLNKGSHYEEEIIDIEYNSPLKSEIQNPYLYINWEQKVLTQEDLQQILICFVCLPDSGTPVEQHKPFDQYLKALAFLAKNDLHLNLIANACALFLSALKSAMVLYGDLKSNEKFTDVFIQNFPLFITNLDDQELFISLIDKLENASNNQSFPELTLDKVLQIKALCDFYFRTKFYSRIKEIKSADAYNT